MASRLYLIPIIIGISWLLISCGGSGGNGSSDNAIPDNGGSGTGGGVPGPTTQALEALGEKLFKDENLSSPMGQSCASCHDENTGFADPDQGIPVSEGVVAGRFGTRNSPTVSYAAFNRIIALIRKAIVTASNLLTRLLHGFELVPSSTR